MSEKILDNIGSIYASDFPILNQKINDHPLVFLDSAASSQKPQCVIDALVQYYQKQHANIHRGVYALSAHATELYENARMKVQQFIHADYPHEIIFVRGTTEAINLVAQSFGRPHFKEDDEIILSEMEHHSNIVPWQLLAEQCNLKLRIIPVLDSGDCDLSAYEKLFSAKTKMVALTHVSNVLGTLNPIKEMIRFAHLQGVPVLIDGAQAISNVPVDVRELDCDFYAFSSHKTYGPTGVGVLYGKTDLLQKMQPYQGGGSMIERVTFNKTTYAKLPYRFEAGTPSIADTIAFGVAIDYLNKIGMEKVQHHSHQLVLDLTTKLETISGVRIMGKPKIQIGMVSFVLEQVHPHDIATVLDHLGIAVRAGHHCAQPLMDRFNIPACIRASFGIYNSKNDNDALVEGIHEVKKVFKI